MEENFSMDWGGGGIVQGDSRTLHLLCTLFLLLRHQLHRRSIRHQIPEVGVSCSKESPGPSSSSEVLRFCLRPFWQQLPQELLEMPPTRIPPGRSLLPALPSRLPPRTKRPTSTGFMSDGEMERIDFGFQKRKDFYDTLSLIFFLIKVFQAISALLIKENASLYFGCLLRLVIYRVSLARVPPDQLSLPDHSGQAGHQGSAGDS